MHTPEGTLERGQVPPYSAPVHSHPLSEDDEHILPHLMSLPSKEDCNNHSKIR